MFSHFFNFRLFRTLQTRIFLTMLILNIFMAVSLILVAIYQYREQAENYHLNRLERKENSVKRDIEYQLDNTTFLVVTEKLPYIFREKIFEMSHVHNLEIALYDMKGNLLITSRASFNMSSILRPIQQNVLDSLKSNINKRIVVNTKFNTEEYLSIYSYIYDHQFNPIGILYIPYIGKNDFYQKELKVLLIRISFIFIFAILISIILAYYSSRLISDPIKEIVAKMKETSLDIQNEKLVIKGGTDELHDLIKAYNRMLDQLEESAVKLATTERESAWREMAKQVAHEIKNPLTPMRLTIQNFERKFNPNDPDSKEKLREYSESLIQQIDTMTLIASAFSDFAKMPVAIKENIDIIDVTQNTLDIFSENYIHFYHEKQHLYANFDKTQLVRVITNLITNAIHAVENVDQPKIVVKITEKNEEIEISVYDNGKGISEDNKGKIFEPKFTTKTSGMGLGLAMLKNIMETYNGTINFESKENVGSTFYVRFPKQ